VLLFKYHFFSLKGKCFIVIFVIFYDVHLSSIVAILYDVHRSSIVAVFYDVHLSSIVATFYDVHLSSIIAIFYDVHLSSIVAIFYDVHLSSIVAIFYDVCISSIVASGCWDIIVYFVITCKNRGHCTDIATLLRVAPHTLETSDVAYTITEIENRFIFR
jgi:hypothetical protein